MPIFQLKAPWALPCWCKNTISCLSNCVIFGPKEMGTKDESLQQVASKPEAFSEPKDTIQSWFFSKSPVMNRHNTDSSE